jgi:hypothetical protein
MCIVCSTVRSRCCSIYRDVSVFLIPFSLPTRLVPLVFFLAYQIWIGLHLHTWTGLLTGYLICYIPGMMLPPSLLRMFERCCCSSLARAASATAATPSTFVRVDDAGKMQPWSHAREEVRSEPMSGIRPATSQQQQQPASISLTSTTAGTGSLNGAANLARSSFPINRSQYMHAMRMCVMTYLNADHTCIRSETRSC